jgi:hypothetical protein
MNVPDLLGTAADWIDKHPGGKEMLLLSIGRDITDLLPSYHPFSDKPMKYLASRKVIFCTYHSACACSSGCDPKPPPLLVP